MNQVARHGKELEDPSGGFPNHDGISSSPIAIFDSPGDIDGVLVNILPSATINEETSSMSLSLFVLEMSLGPRIRVLGARRLLVASYCHQLNCPTTQIQESSRNEKAQVRMHIHG